MRFDRFVEITRVVNNYAYQNLLGIECNDLARRKRSVGKLISRSRSSTRNQTLTYHDI